MKKISPFLQWLILASAIALPFFIIRIFPTLHHVYDLSIFRTWADAWGWGWQGIYINCKSCNYPILGTAFSGGLFSSIDFKNELRVINRFRYYLAMVDALNVLMMYWIFSRLKIQNAPLWAGVIGLLPSTWISSSVWGQIDGIGQFLILLFYILLIEFNMIYLKGLTYYLFLAGAGSLLALMLLTKQLIYFSMAALGLVMLVNIFWISQKPKHIIFSLLTVFGAFITPVLIFDSLLFLKPPYISHLQYVLATGSQHGDQISSLGLNIWVFFYSDFFASSHQTLQIGSLSLAPLSPFSVGIGMFLLLNIMFFVLFLKDLRRYATSGHNLLNTNQLISIFLYFSFVNLSFNLMLTGTHERYLYHFYPFILIACLGMLPRSRIFDRATLIVLFAGSLSYGGFLFIYLIGWIEQTNYSIIRGAAAIHLALFCYLLFLWYRNSTSRNVGVLSA